MKPDRRIRWTPMQLATALLPWLLLAMILMIPWGG